MLFNQGGTVLGSSRGGFDFEKILKFIKEKDIKQLYVIGGDGTHRGAFKIHEGCMKQVYNKFVHNSNHILIDTFFFSIDRLTLCLLPELNLEHNN